MAMSSPTSMPTIEDIFPASRLSFNLNIIPLMMYFPFGIVLTICRTFLLLHYICVQIILSLFLSNNHPIQYFIQRVFLAVLGVVLYKENQSNLSTKPSESGVITVCNKNMHIDSYTMPCWMNAQLATKPENNRSMSAIKLSLLRKFLCSHRQQFLKFFDRNKPPLLHFPEDCASSGISLLKFNSWIFSVDIPIQPCCVKITRFIPVASTTCDSNFMADMMWTFFCPVTIYKVKYLSVMHRDVTNESTNNFAIRVQRRMANEMKVSRTNITSNDLEEYVKTKRVQSRHLILELSKLPERFYPEDIQAMVKKVQEVVDDAPFDIIAKDLELTYSVESTVTNLMEKIIKYKPINKVKNQQDLKVFQSSPIKRHLSFHERKRLFIQEARERYLKKHPEYKKDD